MLIWVYYIRMARAATTADAFNAVAEPRRRQILDVLAGGERPVNDLVAQLGLAQPQVSKHLRVLREVGAVDVRGNGVSGSTGSTGTRSSPFTTGYPSTSAHGRSGSISWRSCWSNSGRRRLEMVMTRSGTAKVTLPTEMQILINVSSSPKHRERGVDDAGAVRQWGHANRGEMMRARSTCAWRQWRYAMDVEGFGEVAFHGGTARSF